MNKGTRVYRMEWRDIHSDIKDPPTVLLRVVYDPSTQDLQFLTWELQTVLSKMLIDLQEARDAQ